MKFGVAVNNLSFSQLACEIIQTSNCILSAGVEHDMVLLYEQPSRPCMQTLFPTMHLCEAWGFNGTIIATSLSTAAKSLSFPSVSRRVFYVYDLEWVRLKQKGYRPLWEIYANPAHLLVARSEEHADAIASAWNTPVAGICEAFDLNFFINLLKEKK